MSKIINFKEDYHQDPEYKVRVESYKERLASMHEEVLDMATQLACAGAWKDWNDTKEEGDIVHFSDEALHDTKDPNVDALLGLCVKIDDVRGSLNL